MNEEAVAMLYSMFKDNGYPDTEEDFKQLMLNNEDAVKTGYSMFKDNGYPDTEEDFYSLVGFKKKDPTARQAQSVIQENSMDSSLAVGSSVPQESPDADALLEVEQQQIDELENQYTPSDTPQAQADIQQEPTTTPIDSSIGFDLETGLPKQPLIASDMRRDDYVPPQPGTLYPTEAELKRYREQQEADLLKTQENIEADDILLKQRQAEEAKQEALNKEISRQVNLGVVEDEGFQSAINLIDDKLIDKPQEEAVQALKEQFKGYGFLFNETGSEFRYGDGMIVTAPNGKTLPIDLDPFLNSTERSEADKLRQWMVANATLKPAEAPSDEISNALKAKEMRLIGRRNDDGTESTVKFTSYEEDGKHLVIPTLFPKDPLNYSSSPDTWMELPFEEARKVAIERGEVFSFDNKEDAEKFSLGGWKDVSTHDLEAKAFYERKGLDYNREKKIYDEYMEATDLMFFLDPNRDGEIDEDIPFNKENLTKEQKETLGDKVNTLYIDGKLRSDSYDLLKKSTDVADRLSDSFLREDVQIAREEFDLYLDKRHKTEATKAAQLNAKVKMFESAITQKSLDEFGLEPIDLVGVDFGDPEKNKRAQYILDAFEESKMYKSYAADKYYNANTYYDMKHNKAINREFADNLDSVTEEWLSGWSRGKGGDMILAASLYPELLGGIDLDDPKATMKLAEALVKNFQEEPEKMSRVMLRYNQARTTDEVINAIWSNPIELGVSLAASSLSQMLPYGYKIVAGTTALGAAKGAVAGLAGGPFAEVTVPAGMFTGATWGFTTGMASTSLAMEYTNEMISAIQKYATDRGGSPLDAELVAEALQSEEVWEEGKRRGFARGIPIATLDFFTGALAGKMLKVGTLASKGRRIGALAAERLVVDPASEGLGELSAQISVGDKINLKDIYGEMFGGFGAKTPQMVLNLAQETAFKSNIEKAALLSDIDYINNESTSNARISEWANNMERLGQITPEENQRIQENVGLRKTSKELLDTGIGMPLLGKNKKALQSRVMKLLAAKQELSSTTNRKELFAKKISEINEEINDIVTTKKLRSKSEQTQLAGATSFVSQGQVIGGVDEQASTTDIRPALPSYTIKKGLRTRKVSKEEFLEYIDGLSDKEIAKLNVSVQNDEQVAKIVTDKVVEAQEKAKRQPEEETLAEDVQETVAEDGVSSKTLEETEAEVDNQEAAAAVAPEEVELTTKQEEEAEVKTTDKTEGIQDLVGQEITLTDDLLNNAETRTVVSVEEVRSESLKKDWTRITLDNGVVVNIPTERAMNKTYKVPKSKLGVVEGQPIAKPTRKRKTKAEIRKAQEERKARREAAKAKAKAEAEAEVTEEVDSDVDQQAVQDLKDIIDADQTGEGGQITMFQLDLDKDSKKDKKLVARMKKRKKEMGKRAEELMKDEPISDKPFNVNKPLKLHSVTIKDNKALVNKTREMSIKELYGKKINLAMADQLKVDDEGRMGGPFFPLIDEMFGKIAWASIDEKAAREIVRGAVKSDNTVVYNMNPSAVDSNLVTLDTLIRKVKESPNSEELFKAMMADILTKKWGKDGKMSPKVHSIAENARTIDEFAEGFAELDVDTKASIFTKTLPSRNVEAGTDVGKMFEAEGISQESIREENIEQYASEMPMGALTTVLEITDSEGNPVTEETIEDALIIGEEAIREAGFPVHRNYPVYIRGRVKGVLTETAPIWTALPEFRDTMNLKIANRLTPKEKYSVTIDGKKMSVKVSNNPNGTRTLTLFNQKDREVKGSEIIIPASSKMKTETIVKRKFNATVDKIEYVDTTFTTKEAESAAIRSASMRAGTAFNIEEAVQLQYEQFINRLSASFPGVEVVTDQETFDNMLSDIRQKTKSGNKVLTTKDQTVYGFVYDGKVYLNPSLKSYNTAIHEFGHIWLNVAKEMNPEAYQKGLELIEQDSTYVQEVENNAEYQRVVKNMRANGSTEQEIRNYILEEALATAIGDKGESFVNEATKRNFKNWLNDLFDFVKKLVGISKLTSEQIQNLSLEEFLEGVVADVLSENQQFKDAQVENLNLQLQMMTTPPNPSIESVVEIGRREGFENDAIRVVLQDMGFKPKDITKALEVDIDLVTKMPKEFGNVEGGSNVGVKLFNEVKEKLNAFAIQGPRGGRGRRGVITKSMGEIREKAIEIMKENPIFQAQDAQIQMELISGFDRVLGIRKNPNVTKQIAAIRANLRERRKAVKDLVFAQKQMRIAIRKMLPPSKNYNNTAVNAVLQIVNNTTAKNFKGQIFKAMKEVEKQRLLLRNQMILKMQEIVIAKAKKAKTQSGKVRSAGLDAIGQSYFAEVNRVLRAAIKKDADAMQAIKDSIDENEYNLGMQAIEEGEKPTIKQQTMIDRQIAIDSFADVLTMELEEVEALLEDVKLTRAESIARFNNRRESRRGVTNFLKTVANEQMKEDYKELYDEFGQPLGKNVIDARRERITAAFRENGVYAGLKEWAKQFMTEGRKYTTNALTQFFYNNITHLGTIVNILDRGKDGFFTNFFYDNLNIMDENSLKGLRTTTNRIDAITQSIVGKSWMDWKYSLGNETIDMQMMDSKKGQIHMRKLNKDQAMRLIALSMNEVQRNKLEAQGITDEKLDKLKKFVGEDQVKIIERVVDFLSNTYFEETNDVYSQVNDVNLQYVENYFPTQTISKSNVTGSMLGDFDIQKVFSAEFSPALKERTDKTSDIQIGLSFTDVLEEHTKQMERYKAYALGVKEMDSVLRDEGIVNLLEESGTKEVFKQILNYAINPNAGLSLKEDAIEWLQRKFTGFALAFKLIQIPKQMSSFIQAYDKYAGGDTDIKRPGMKLANFIVDYTKVILNLREEIKEAREMSATFDNRIKMGLEGDILGLESGTRTFKRGRADQGRRGRITRGFEKAAGFATVAGDILGVLGYKAVYNRAKRDGMSDAQALRLFNDYNATQQTRRATERNLLQQSRSWPARVFTTFGSTIFLQMNQVYQSMNSMIQDISRGKAPKSKDIKKFAMNYAVANVLFTTASYSGAILTGGKEDRDRALKAILDAAMGKNLIFQIPLVGAGLEFLDNKISGSRKPIRGGVNPMMSLFRKVTKAYDGLSTGSIAKASQPFLEIMIGAQIDSPLALLKLLGGDTSEDNIFQVLGISKSYRPGYGQKKSKNSFSTKKKKTTSKSELKLVDPDLYDELYGEGSEYQEMQNELKELNEELLKDLEDLEDE